MSGDRSAAGLPMDSDVDLHVQGQRREWTHGQWAVLLVISLGGALGALARYGVTLALPTAAGGFPWSTFLINVLGCALIGVLMVLISEVVVAHRLLRPFLGVGVLGGFTTFSTYAAETRALLTPGSLPVAAGYFAGTLVAALLAVLAGVAGTRAVVRRTTGRP